MITALDHFTLICPDIDTGVTAYENLLGRRADWRSEDGTNGTATALFRTANTTLEIMAPHGDGPIGDRLRVILADTGPGLASLAFATGDLDEAHRLLGRRGLAPSEITSGTSENPAGRRLDWRRFRCDDGATAEIRTFVITDRSNAMPLVDAGPGAVTSLDHLVISTPNPDRAAALYGARLGLRFALDRQAEQWNTRFLFFRVGGLTVEVVSRLDASGDPAGADRFFGLTWAVDDIQVARERLAAHGLDVSAVRTGRKPGSEVFTLRDGHLGVPTLFIAHGPG
ncbi:MAG: VOC family protein [Pseudomonadota bacterium]